MEAPPNNGPDYTRAVPRRVRRRREDPRVTLHPVPARGRGRRSVAQPGRRHPSQRARGARWWPTSVWSVARTRPATTNPGGSMIQLRGVSKTVMSGGAAAHHPASPRPRRARRAVPGHRRPVGQRQVDAARADCRARLAIDGHDRDRRHRHHAPRRRRAGARCGARRSASCSSSSTWCRRSPRSRTSRCRWRSRAGRDAAGARAGAARRGGAARPRASLSRRSCRAASSSASPSRGRWPTTRRSSSPTSPPAISTARTAGTSSTCCSRCATTRSVTLVLVTHDPHVAAVADARLELRDGRPVDDDRASRSAAR